MLAWANTLESSSNVGVGSPVAKVTSAVILYLIVMASSYVVLKIKGKSTSKNVVSTTIGEKSGTG